MACLWWFVGKVEFDEADVPEAYLCKPWAYFNLEYTGGIAIISGHYKLAVEPLEHFWQNVTSASVVAFVYLLVSEATPSDLLMALGDEQKMFDV